MTDFWAQVYHEISVVSKFPERPCTTCTQAGILADRIRSWDNCCDPEGHYAGLKRDSWIERHYKLRERNTQAPCSFGAFADPSAWKALFLSISFVVSEFKCPLLAVAYPDLPTLPTPLDLLYFFPQHSSLSHILEEALHFVFCFLHKEYMYPEGKEEGGWSG